MCEAARGDGVDAAAVSMVAVWCECDTHVELWELHKDAIQLLLEVGLRELDLAHVEFANAVDLEARSHLRRCFSLSL